VTYHQKLKLSLITLAIISFYTKDSNAFVIDFDKSIEKSKHFYLKGDYNSSSNILSELNKKYPQNPSIRYNLANSLYKKGDYEQAEKNFRYIAENKNIEDNIRFNSFYNLGNSLYNQNKLEDAEKAYLSALQINPNDIQAKKNLEKVRIQINKKQKENNELKSSNREFNYNKNKKQNSNNTSNSNIGNNSKNDKLNKDIKRALNNLEENNKDFMKNQILKNLTGYYGIEKDW
jgi:tetratricopeptide (TPR) repeat protein